MPLSERSARFLSGRSWLLLWGIAVALTLALRPILPVDETRYLSVAWEMWRRDNWLIPYLNGAPYADKPPLLFWGMLLGWRLFGVSQWWPRLLPPLFGLLSALLLVRLARRLTPESPELVNQALPFLSGALWVTYSTVLLFDTLLTACVLLALFGVVEVWLGRRSTGWAACAAGIGLGLLAKGPVVLVHVLPVAILAPWWAREQRRPASWRAWYAGLVVALAVGAVLALGWALAAGAQGGPAYRAAILWDQTAGRVTESFAHRRPWWWYLRLIPVILFPWSLWRPWWQSILAGGNGLNAVARRFALAWVIPGGTILSLISGKQVHYLLPLLPGVALLAAVVHTKIEVTARTWDLIPLSIFLASIGVALIAGPLLHRGAMGTAWQDLSPWWGVVPLVGGTMLALIRRGGGQVIGLSLVSPALLILALLDGREFAWRSYDLRPLARLAAQAEASGRPIAFVGKYSGQLHFLGRLQHPFDQISPPELRSWALEHPAGLLIRASRSRADTAGAILVQRYGGGVLGAWNSSRIPSNSR